MFDRVKAITLDLDDTLWDIERVIVRAERTLYAWLGEHFPRITERHSLGDLRARRVAVSETHPELQHDMSALRRRALHWHAREAGYEPAAVEQGFEVFYAARNQVELFADVIPALAALRRRYPLIALTNGNADLGAIGIGEFFRATVCAAEVRASKPHPAMFEAASARLGCTPDELLHVGDDPLTDVHGAHAAGAAAVWVNRKRRAWPAELPPPAHEIVDLRELVRLLGLVNADIA